MKFSRTLIAFFLLIGACATLWHRASAITALHPTIRLTDSADSIFIRLAWSPVKDARGDTVAHYIASITDSGNEIASTETRDTVFIASVPKIPGNSHAFRGSVYAVDIRGNKGAMATSDVILVAVPDPGPPAPSIRLDTIPLALEPRVDSVRMYFPEGNFDSEGNLVMVIGDTIQGCAVGFLNGQMVRPTIWPEKCQDHTLPAMLYRPFTGSVKVRQAE